MQESLVPTFTPDQLRHNAKLIRKYLDSLGIKLTNSTALDVAANGIGYANYNIAKAALEKCEAEQKGNEYQFVTPKFPNPSGSTGQLQRIVGNTASGVVDLGPKIELSVFLYMYDNANLFIRNANDANMVFVIKKDFVPDNAYDEEAQRRGLWFPKKGDRVRLVWKKPNTRTIPEIAPIEASATILSVDDETRRRSLPQSTIIESIEYDPNIIYARPGAGAAFYLSDLPTGQLVQQYLESQNDKAMNELIRRGMISSPEEFDLIKNVIDANTRMSMPQPKAKYRLQQLFLADQEMPCENRRSTALFSSARFGKTFRMMQMAKTLVDSRRPFLYFIADYHSHILRDANYKNVTQHHKQLDAFNGDGSALFSIEASTFDQNQILRIIQSAIDNKYHIFIDESPAMWRILEYVVDAGYRDFTVALQSPCDIGKYIDGRAAYANINSEQIERFHTRNGTRYTFDRIMIGKSNDIRIAECYNDLCMWQDGVFTLRFEDIAHLNVGEFLHASNS